MQNNWYTMTKPGDTQGTIADESTGRTVAVCYDAKDAPLLAAAPDLLAALSALVDEIECGFLGLSDFGSPRESDFETLTVARAAIAKATDQA